MDLTAVTKCQEHEQLGEERVCFSYTCTSQSTIERTEGSNLEAETDRGHGGVLLTAFLLMACLACFLTVPRTLSLG